MQNEDERPERTTGDPGDDRPSFVGIAAGRRGAEPAANADEEIAGIMRAKAVSILGRESSRP